MEFNLRINIVMGKDLSIEANNIVEAMEKGKELIKHPYMRRELTETEVAEKDGETLHLRGQEQ